MKSKTSRLAIAALTLATLALPPAIASADEAGAKCGPKMEGHKCHAKCHGKAMAKGKCAAKCEAKCMAKCKAKCAAKCAPKCMAKCAPKAR